MQINIKSLSVPKVGIKINYTNGQNVAIQLKYACVNKVNINFSNIGPKGLPGEGSVLSGLAGEVINADSVVMLKDGLIYKNNPILVNAYLCCGFAKNSAGIGELVNVTISGEHESAGMALLQGFVYYAAPSGGATTIPPVLGVSQAIGAAKNSDTMFVNISEPFIMI
jgi:hypothetical protein